MKNLYDQNSSHLKTQSQITHTPNNIFENKVLGTRLKKILSMQIQESSKKKTALAHSTANQKNAGPTGTYSKLFEKVKDQKYEKVRPNTSYPSSLKETKKAHPRSRYKEPNSDDFSRYKSSNSVSLFLWGNRIFS